MTFAVILLVWSTILPADAGSALTFEEALRRARGGTSSTRVDPVSALRGPTLPNVRIETVGNVSRTLDPFTADPLDTQALTSALAFDYPLWDGGARRAQLEALELRARFGPEGLEEAKFTSLVESFGDLYLAQQQEAILRSLQATLSSEAERSARLLQAAEISALEASNRRSMAAAWASQLLEAEVRRDDAATRLREILGLENEPVVVLDETATAPAIRDENERVSDDRVLAGELSVEASRARERAVEASSRFTASLSGLAGATTARSEYRGDAASGTYGIYGLRVHLSYPLFRNTSIAAVEARLAVEESLRARDQASIAARQRAASLLREEAASQRRIELFGRQVEEARLTAASIDRLANAGLRGPADVAFVQAEVERRRLELLAVRVQRWKLVQHLRWLGGSPEPGRR
jgi:outer membrane protein TolC